MKFEDLKKYFQIKSPLTQFSLILTLFIVYSIINLIDFTNIKGEWWNYQNNSSFFTAVIN